MPKPRRKPYTTIGIRRLKCSRCSNPGYATWQICALDRRRCVMCRDCDCAVNEMVLRFMRWPGLAKVMKAYRAKVKASE